MRKNLPLVSEILALVFMVINLLFGGSGTKLAIMAMCFVSAYFEEKRFDKIFWIVFGIIPIFLYFFPEGILSYLG